MSSSNQNSETCGSSSPSLSPPSKRTKTHQTKFQHSSDSSKHKTPIEATPDQENENPIDNAPNQETQTPETEEIKRTETAGEAILNQENPIETTLNQETQTPDEESSEEESSEEEYDPNENLILLPHTSQGNEQYDDVTVLKYILAYENEDHALPLSISIKEREPTRYEMNDLHLFIKERCFGDLYAGFSRCRLRNKIIRMQNKYRNLVQEKGVNPTVERFDKSFGKLHFDLLKKVFK